MSLSNWLRLSSHTLRSTVAFSSRAHDWFFKGYIPDGTLFSFYPSFLSVDEQDVLLRSSLKKLDAMDSNRARRRRRANAESHRPRADLPAVEPIASLFLPDELYEFQEGHYDGVIKHFRETHLTSWPQEDYPALLPTLTRLNALIPEVETQTHLLHLGSSGEILPHVDNLEASGSWILGVSLGSPRVMRLESAVNDNDTFDVLLPSGSVYIQRLRYEFNHSILKGEVFRDEVATEGQRISIMIRDRKGSRDRGGIVQPHSDAP